VFDLVVTGYPPPHLSGPVNSDSRPVRRVGVRFAEVDGRPVVWGPMIGTVCELSESAAQLWLELDGRTVSEMLDDAVERGIATDERSVWEVIRSMRTLGLVEDIHDTSERTPYRPPAETATATDSDESTDATVVAFEDDSVDAPLRLTPIELLDRMVRTSDPRDFEALARRCEHLAGYVVPVGTTEREINALGDRTIR
jgi:hypothetical protein